MNKKMTSPTGPQGRVVLRDIIKEFPTDHGVFRAVDDVNIEIEPGEFLTLLGPSGCGKTTTLRMVAGFETPSSGAIELDGKDIVAVTPEKRPMTMVFQSYALFPHLSVRENIEYGLKIKKMKRAEMDSAVDAVLASMSLTGLQDRAPSQLSGGQQQRVALARAIVMQPKVLLFDEPLSNLDAKLRERMRMELRQMQRRLGITSLYVTHDQSEAMTLSDRVLVMNNGKIEQVASPEEIYRHPATVFVADFIGRANFLPCDVLERGSDQVRVNVLHEELTIPAHSSVAGSDDTVVLVRPESMRLVGLADSDPRAIVGRTVRVLSTVFFGDHVEYEVESESGTIVVIESDPDIDKIAAEGDWAKISFDPRKAWALPAA
ncbi:Spermidine/putrescine import ATP-binding protein PotA [Arcanobacterium haemolyticum]|uniref:ABC transporter ATP-binding protein n=1 Tax=Arcanobacterium haemolyticum TaxID=28264 RepID=UPI000D9AD696|nr:ABC transporter ATP-binding protein [Arcanobacterium haemolyticum]SPT75905.1 Spermidine/putrescine import ATP-binding protein PotA [Arcanobacterium haemolyticum]